MTTIFRYIPTLVVMAAIFIISHLPGDKIHPPRFLAYDKFWHSLEYAVLAITLLYAKRPPIKHIRKYASILTICVVYAVSDEIHQSFIPLRYASVLDVFADSLGAILAVSGWYLFYRKR